MQTAPSCRLDLVRRGFLLFALTGLPLLSVPTQGNPYFVLSAKWTFAAACALALPPLLVLLPRHAIRPRGPSLLLLVAGIWSALSTLFSGDPATSLTTLIGLLSCIILFFAAAACADPVEELDWITLGLAWVTIPICLYVFLQHVGYNPVGFIAEGTGHLSATFPNRNLLGGFLLVGLPLLVRGALQPARALSLSCQVALVGAFPTFLLSRTRSAWLALFATAAIWILIRLRQDRAGAPPMANKRTLGWIVAAAAFLALGASVLATWAGRERSLFETVWELTPQSKSVVERLAFMEAAARITADHPVFGCGPGRYRVAGDRVRAKVFERPSFRRVPDLAAFAHQGALQTAAETGVPGMLLWFIPPIWLLLRRNGPTTLGAVRFSIGAVLLQSMAHYPLQAATTAAWFWVLAGLLEARPAASQATPGPLGRRVAAAIVLGCLAAGLFVLRGRAFLAERMFQIASEEAEFGDPNRALAAFLDSGRLAPGFHEAWANAGAMLYRLGAPGLALVPLRRAHELAPHDPTVHYQIGQVARSLDNHALAMAAMGQALADNPHCVPAALALADLALEEGHPDHADRYLDGIEDLAQEYSLFWRLRGRVAEDCGDIPAARRAWEEGLSRNPINTTLRDALRRLETPEPP